MLLVLSVLFMYVFVFTQRHEFAVYSEYCTNHPHAVNEMNTLQQNEQYMFFFEVGGMSTNSCRVPRVIVCIS